ncbi:MAG: T9SS type A sorting domain-containing protein, partial [Ignavibacteria bacterium]|nr:T9SS type A sorting domain-containing protein [Ignavibacteria bacterium]
VSVKNFSFYPLKPADNQKLTGDSIRITGLNPNIDAVKNNVRLFLQVDTTNDFSSPYSRTFYKTGFTGITSSFIVPFNNIDSIKTIFWRMNCIINNTDTLNWTEIRKFSIVSNSNHIDSIINIRKANTNAFEISELYKVQKSGLGLILNMLNNKIMASSFSSYPSTSEPTFFTSLNKYFDLTPDSLRGGLNVGKFSKATGYLIERRHIRFTASNSSDSLVEFLNTFDTTHILALVKMVPVYSTNNLSSSARALLRQFGSIYADSAAIANILSWVRWSFISYRGLPNPFTSELYSSAGWSPATSILTSSILYTTGTITQTLGPAQTWQFFNWEQVLYPNSTMKFDVYGINRQNTEVLLLPNVTTNNYVDLQGINAYQYPRLKLITTLAIDTISGTQSPLFKGMSLKYVGPPEIALDNNSIFKSDSIVSMGDSIGIGGLYYNVGYVPVNGHTRNFYALDANGNKVLLRSDTIFQQLKVDSSMFVKATFKVNGLPIYKKYNNQVALLFEVNSLNQNDIYDYNNSVISTFFVKGSLTNFATEVFSDGIKLFGNDYVRSKPELLVKLSGKSIDEILQSDTNAVRIMLNNNFISLNTTGSKTQVKLNLTRITEKDNLILKFSPELKNGLNELKIISFNNSTYDSAKFVLNVTSEVSLINIFNFPNPMKNDTKFDFILTGNEPPADCRIKIYTTAGRVIKEIVMPVSIGYNQIYWDGRDADGDNLANGVYFYRIFIRGNTEITSDVKKLVVLR